MSSSNPCEPKLPWAMSSGESNKVDDDIGPKEALAWASWVCRPLWSWSWACEEVGLDFLIGGWE